MSKYSAAVLENILDEHGTVEERGHWVAIDGPDSRCGVDYFFVNRRSGREAYANDDQGFITVTIEDEVVHAGTEDARD